ncbi:MAG: sugar-binding protein, partial [Planctomycetia bacterium]|nr:sugar-binding protein [Planctomycetia bacterium]
PGEGPGDFQAMWYGTVENWRNATNFGGLYFERPVPKRLAVDLPLAPYLEGAIVIDGDFGDWQGLVPPDKGIKIDRPEQVAFDRRVGEHKKARISAFAMTAWDKDNFYLAVDVTDPHVRPSPEKEGRPWEGTALEVYMDTRPPDKQGGKTYDNRVLQLLLVPGADKASAYFKALHREDFKASVASQRTEKGYRIEASIAWENFPELSLRRLRQLGFDLAVDARGPEGGRCLQLMWHGTGDAWKDPSVFGMLQVERAR